MKDANQVRRRIGQLKKGSKDGGLLEVVEGLLELQVGLMERVARLEAGEKGRVSAKPARRGTPGARREVNRDVAGRRTGEPKRTERPVGRNSRVETDIDKGIV